MKKDKNKKQSTAVTLQSIIDWIQQTEAVIIRFDCLDEDQWSIITKYEDNEDTEVSIRLHLNNHFDLYLGYYDEDDEFHESIIALSDEDLSLIPEVMKKVMKKVLDDEKDVKVNGTFLK